MPPSKLQLQISIPPLFCCPISLELMRDPVTLCTGLTYDRPSIEQWFEQGHNTCPASMQELKTQDLVPNHTLRRLIQDWCVANRSKGIERIPTPKPLLDSEQIRTVLREVARGFQIGSNLKKIKNLAKESQKNRKIMASVGTAQAMAELLGRYGTERSGLEELEICEDAIAILLLVPAEASEKAGLIRDTHFSSLSWILSTGSCEGKINTAKLLSAIAMDDKHKSSIGSTETLISGLAGLLRYNLYQKALNAGLVALQNICTNPSNRLKAVEAGAIPLLLDLLLDSSKRNIEASLAVLENLCRCAEGRMEVASHALAMAVLVKTILAVSDLATDYAVNILWAVCNAIQCKFVLQSAVQAGAFTQLLLFVQSCSSGQTKKKALGLLKLLQKTWSQYPCKLHIGFSDTLRQLW